MRVIVSAVGAAVGEKAEMVFLVVKKGAYERRSDR
jgi:hypothetical protein